MLFTTVEFVGFFIIAYFAFLAFRGRARARKLVLLACSYWFYTTWNPPFVLILMFSTLLDFIAGKRIGTAKSRAGRSGWLLVSCAGNLGVLAFFKYADFIASNVWFIMPQTAEYPAFFQSIVLPLGISFYTFQSMSYTIDVYRKERDYETDLSDFALYISFFPQLIAGPILRSTHFLPQLKVDTYPSSGDVLAGLDQLVRGFAKKILIADNLGVYVYTVDIAPTNSGPSIT